MYIELLYCTNACRSHHQWQPGECLLAGIGRETINSSNEPGLVHPHHFNSLEITGAIQTLQDSVNTQFADVCSKLQAIDSRISLLETKHKTLEEEVKSSPSSQASISPALTGSGKRRRRVTPTGLQVWYIYLFQ